MRAYLEYDQRASSILELKISQQGLGPPHCRLLSNSVKLEHVYHKPSKQCFRRIVVSVLMRGSGHQGLELRTQVLPASSSHGISSEIPVSGASGSGEGSLSPLAPFGWGSFLCCEWLKTYSSSEFCALQKQRALTWPVMSQTLESL